MSLLAGAGLWSSVRGADTPLLRGGQQDADGQGKRLSWCPQEVQGGGTK